MNYVNPTTNVFATSKSVIVKKYVSSTTKKRWDYIDSHNFEISKGKDGQLIAKVSKKDNL